MNKERIKEAIELAKELGLSSVEVDGLKFEIGSTTPSKQVPEMKAEDLVSPLSVLDEMSEDEILFWSTSYYDELQSKKTQLSKLMEEEKLNG